MKLISWNVNGIRAAMGKDFFNQFYQFNADVVCIQETKAQDDQVKEALSNIKDYSLHSVSAEKKGYSGVCILSKEAPKRVTKGISLEEHDQEGRVLCCEYEKFFMVNVYVPNSGDGLKRLDYRHTWDLAFARYLSELRTIKPVIITGDFNVAHQAIDLARPKENYNKTAGYTQTEIDGLNLIMEQGFVDSYRLMNPDKVQYSFWSARFGARAKNLGWRIDYFLVDNKLQSHIRSAEILDHILGSDHCPISLDLSL